MLWREIFFRPPSRCWTEEERRDGTIVSAEGFVPVAATSKLLVTSTGTLLGRSGSDVLDADIHAEAQRVLAQGSHRSRQFCVLDKDAVVNGWYRAWTVELLIEPLREQGYEILRLLVALEDTGHRGALATVLTEHPRYPAGCRKLLVCDDGTMVGRLGDARLEAGRRHRGQEVLLGEQRSWRITTPRMAARCGSCWSRYCLHPSCRALWGWA